MNKPALAFFFVFSLLFTPAFAQQKLNILFLFSDDQRVDAVGAYGNPYVKTPNIDQLAYRGVRFTNNFCMGSHHGAVCAPSRAMLMSGKTLFHVYDKLERLPTLPKTLKENGYITFSTGKWHNERSAFQAGFMQGKNIFFGGMSDHFQVPVVDLQADGSFSEPVKKGFSTDLFADAAIDFLENHAASNKDQPFFAYVAFTTPHDPRSPKAEFLDLYDPKTLPIPANYQPVHPFNLGPMTIRDEVLNTWPRTPEDIQNHLADYYGLITHMDAQIGRIIGTLQKNGLYENTIIIFSSDHGLAIGSHGLLGKQNLYEHSLKAPLIISGPGIPENEVNDALVYLYDLFPTLCNLVEADVPQGVEGKNLLPVIKGEQKDVRNSLFTTYADVQRAVKDHRWKLIRYPKIGYTQLFDLKNDPYELNNLAEEAGYEAKTEEMMQLLQEWQTQTGDTLALTAENVEPREFDPSGFERQPDQHQPPYVLEKYFNEK